MAWLRLELPNKLHARLKYVAQLRGITLREYLLDALERVVTQDERTSG